MAERRPSRARLTIFGGSTRAAAESAVRAGWQPTCFDMFADADLDDIVDVHRIDGVPDLRRRIDTVPADPWIFTGGLENHPQLLARLAQRGQRLGTSAEGIARVRCPFEWTAAIANAGLPALPVCAGIAPPAAMGPWVWKPLDGAGGLRVRDWPAVSDNPPIDPTEGFFQQRAFGASGSAVCLADSRADVRVAGYCLHGAWQTALHAPLFGWCGGVGPVRVPAKVHHQVQQIAEVLAKEFGLLGLFGLDLIFTAHTAWPLEINPRYTATVELLEIARRTSLLSAHFRLCAGELVTKPGAFPDAAETPDERQVWKVIPYAPQELTVGGDLRSSRNWSLDVVNGLQNAWPTTGALWHADCPRAGSRIAAGQPVCSLLQIATPSVCLGDAANTALPPGGPAIPDRLQLAVDSLFRSLSPTGSGPAPARYEDASDSS